MRTTRFNSSPLPYSSNGPKADGRPIRLTALPYFQWNNRGTHGMHVWLPIT
jgi:DUF1680 family protein